jgi:cysteinyl-tRNA synthetase
MTHSLVEIDKKPGEKFVGYVCGITPYDEPHLGHVRTALVFDLFQRFLEARSYEPIFVSNFTDVDDKIIERSRALGIHPFALAEKYERIYYKLMDFLNVKPLYVYARVSQVIPDIIDAIETLIRKGYAYVAKDGVYFSVSKFPNYGKLSGRPLEDITQLEARVEPSPFKRDPRDFALWKSRKETDNIWWKSPWGDGRPGWHMECTVISTKFGGFPLDFHGGGSDLIFPHHENEKAQSEALMGREPFARVWMHTGMLKIGTEEMHKSLGNFIGSSQIMADYDADVIRYLLLSTYYRDPVTFSAEAYDQATAAVANIRSYKERLHWAREGDIARQEVLSQISSQKEEFIKSLETDLNTAAALACVHKIMGQLPVEELNKAEAKAVEGFLEFAMSDIFGLKLSSKKTVDESLIQDLIDLRSSLREQKKFSDADAIRNVLSRHGFNIEDTKYGTRWIKE